MKRLVFFGLLLAAVFALVSEPARSAKADFDVAMTATDLANEIRLGRITSEEATRALLKRIEQLDRSGPKIQSVIALNPHALEAAIALDREAQSGQFRGPLHGVPVLIKDNIESRELPTTAGSLALLENRTNRDSAVVARLREAGMVILGKTNLSEWANYRSSDSISGWSGVGGLTKNPYDLRRSPCGSSSGSAAAVAAGFVPVALGTETNGSITCPAAVMGLVGFKPTIGLVSRRHIVPLSPRQDSAGPITRTVRDAAMLLTVLAGTDPLDPATQTADSHIDDYVDDLDEGIRGMRIGVFRWALGNSELVGATFNPALTALEDAGAVLVDIDDFAPEPLLWQQGDRILQTEFKTGLNRYLASTPADIDIRSIEDVIDFNRANADRELTLFDQSILIKTAAAGSASDPAFQAVVAEFVRAARDGGVDKLLADNDVRLLVMPTTKPAAPIDLLATSEPVGGPLGAGWLASAAGYPVLTVPMGDHQGLPLGMTFMGTAWDDAAVLRAGYAFENKRNVLGEPPYTDGDIERSEFLDILAPLD
ncbi:MAG: amidase [Pseudomonadota bacterium]